MSQNTTDKPNSYTAALAYDPKRHRIRTLPGGLCTSSSSIDAIQGYISSVTFCLLTAFMIMGMLALVPSLVYAKLVQRDNYFNSSSKRGSNISTSSATGSLTAVKTLSARSQMCAQESGGPDDMAPLLMSKISAFGDGIPGSLIFTKTFLLLARINFYVTERLFTDQMAAMIPDCLFGETALLQARTCWFDDCVDEFVMRNPKSNVVILGAGYDSRCYRMGLVGKGISVYEIDAAGTQKVKRRVVAECGIATKGVTYVLCNFEKDDWLECLKSSGFDRELPTLFVWEGVVYYITREAIIDTFKNVTLCGKGSCIAFDYLFSRMVFSPTMQKASQSGGEQLKFGLNDADEAESFVVSNGLAIFDHIQAKEMVKRYLPKHFDGRPVGYLGNFGGFLLACNV